MLNQTAFGLAMGAVYAAWMTLLALGAAFLHVGGGMVAEYGRFFPGYRPTPLGALLGGVYGLAIGTIFGLALAGLYNALAGREQAVEIGPVRLVRR